MKSKFTLVFFALLATAFLLVNNAAGPGNIQDKDRTGSPLSEGSCSAPGCHSGGGFAPDVTIELLKDGAAVDLYQPGTSYDLKVTITASTGTPSGYGFQAVALDVNNDDSGAWGTPPAGVQSLTLSNNRSYVEHSSTQAGDNFFEVEWTAPQAGTGDVTFYAAGNAVNANNTSTGDAAGISNLVVAEEGPDGINDGVNLSDFTIFPNPVDDVLNFEITSRNSGDFEIQITDIHGKVVYGQNIELIQGQNKRNINVSNLGNGLYMLHLIQGQDIAVQPVLKM